MADIQLNVLNATLSTIQSGLNIIDNEIHVMNSSIEVLDQNVDAVEGKVATVCSELKQLAEDFHAFVRYQMQTNNLTEAQNNLIRVRQEIASKFGRFEHIRATATGILQATDVGIVKKDTISNATEEMMISTPGYWLAPCLVALAAWISDQRELAERALKEGIRRNDEKTSLFFALICRRADRKSAALKWTKRYLENQDEENLDRQTVIILDAYASGLLGADSEGIISGQMSEWLEHLADKPGFVEQQTKQWSDAIKLKKQPYSSDDYPYLKQYSKTWPALQEIMEGATLHAEILDYFTSIFEQEMSTDSLKAQLDEILNSLVSDFDEEELPYRKEERFNQVVVDLRGDKDMATQKIALEEAAFKQRKNFTQLLTDAAMNPESSHSSISTQKFAIALSKEWISNAYNDVVATNRMNIPGEIEINVDTFNDKTSDGKDEAEILGRFNNQIDREKAAALAPTVLTGGQKFCLWGGLIFIVAGLGIMFAVNGFLGILFAIAGGCMLINYIKKKKDIDLKRASISARFEQKRKSGSSIIKATLAEVVDFRAEFAEKDAESEKVNDFLEQISPDQYVRKLADSGRRIKIQ